MEQQTCVNTIKESKYCEEVVALISNLENSQSENIKKAGEIIADVMKNEGILHVFSTGHSHMMVEEMFYRAGGLVQVNPIFDPVLMLHEGAVKSTKIERLPGYAATVLQGVKFKENEPIIIISNSGINPVPVEMAMLCKEKNLKVIAITSVGVSKNLTSRHPSGKKLMDIADIVIDNCVGEGDATVEIPNTNQKIGGVSSIAGIYIVQRIVLSVVNQFLEEDKTPPIYMSANVPGGDQHNGKLIEKYKERIRCLY